MMRALRALLASGLLLTAAFGCDLFDTGFTFSTDPQSFTLDSAALGLTIPGAAKIPAIPCAANDVCAAASSQLSCNAATYSCKIVCGASKTCAVTATAESAVPVDVSSKIKNNTQAAVLSKVSLQRLALTVRENTLTFKTPAIDVYVGPGTATKTTDAGVVKLGTIPAIEAKQVPAPMNIQTTDEGNAILAGFIRDYTTPFKMLARASLSFASGDALPQGRFSFDVVAYLEVNP